MHDMAIARLENGEVKEVRNIEITDVPAHKRGQWRTVVDAPPAHNPKIETLNRAGWLVTDITAELIYEVLPLVRERIVLEVKAEAQRRIVALTGATDIVAAIIKQLNALMRSTKLVNAKADGKPLTEAQKTEATQLEAFSDAVELIRRRSNELEAMDPIPADFTDDKWWQ